MIGTVIPTSASRATISGTAAAAASLFTVTRTSSLPDAANRDTCATVETTSAVSVLVMDWTRTGLAPPTPTPPMSTATVGLLGQLLTLSTPPNGTNSRPAPANSVAVSGRI